MQNGKQSQALAQSDSMQLGASGKLPKRAVVNMQAYRSGAEWSFVLGGHDVGVVDMSAGDGYTVTTDLISNKVIGLAWENSLPFVAIYEKVLHGDIQKLLSAEESQLITEKLRVHVLKYLQA